MPILIVSFSIIGKISAKISTSEAKAYGKAGAVAEEVLGAIRTVFAFEGEKKELARYEENLEPARKGGVKRVFVTGVGVGIMWLVIYASYALAFW